MGELTKLYKLKDNEVKYFVVNIPSTYDYQKDLVIKVQSSDQYGDPDLFISRRNQKPSSQGNSDWACATYGKDICSIGHQNISANQNFYIGVKCLYSCKFTLLPSLVSQMTLEDGQELQLEFQALETKLFRFKVPAKTASKDAQNQVKSVTIGAASVLPQADNILLTASTQADVIPTSASRKGVAGWRKGQTLRLSENGEDWCTDCWITILVDVTDPGQYYVIAKSNIGVAQLQADRKFDDVAFFGDKICYKYYVQSETNDVFLRVKQYSGLISFTMNPKKPAESFSEGAFKHVSPQNTALVVSAKDRNKVGQPKGLYYICVQTHMTSTYSLLVQEYPMNRQFTYIEEDYDENGEVQGTNMTIYMYKVPPLDYQGEDIKLEFRLTTLSGTTPTMAIQFCQETKDHKKCASGLSSESVLGPKSNFQKANIMGNDLTLGIDHDERTCQDVYNGECYYTIAIIGNSKPEEFTTFQIKVMHSQLNYYTLQEGQMITDYVNLGTYRYYSFTLLPDEKVKNVTFKLNTIHGDADIYVSRKHLFPNKIDYEKSSVKTNVAIDEVYFDDDNITTSYYIGVYSFQYSTFNLVVKVDRQGQTNTESIPLLIEGVPYRGSIHNEDSSESFKIQVKQLKGYEKSIKIQLSPIKKKVQYYVNYEKQATDKDYIWFTNNNSLEISTKDKNFHREGTYYVTVYPRYNIWDRITDDYYTFMILYTTQDNFFYLQNQNALEYTQRATTSQFYRHFVTKGNSDISVSMTVFSGNPSLYVSINPDYKFPNEENHDFNSKSQTLVSGSKGKAIYIPAKQIQKSSNSCGNYGSLMNSEEEPCAIYIGVFCADDCKYSLKLSYERDGPQQVIVGVPQHDIVKEGSYKYYFLNVRQGKTQEIFSALDSLSGNTDLFVKFQDNPQDYFQEQWELPDKINYDMKSVEVLSQDVIKIQPQDLQDCFDRYKLKDSSADKECTIIYAVYSPKQSEFTDDSQLEQVRYNFVVYTDIIQLMNASPISGQVDEGEFQYYIFEAMCTDCPIIVSLSTFGSGDPDLYINIGDQKLPTRRSSDIQSSTYRSEMVTIDLQNSAIKNKRLSSLKGTYTIGVYGNKKSTFTISATQEKNPMTVIDAGFSVKRVQEPYETTYFLYYHMQEGKDFKVQLDVKTGTADILMKTFQELEENQNLADRIPRSKRDAQWSIQNILPTSKSNRKELLVLNQEKNFCANCYYIIGVFTQDKKTDYTISVNMLDANYNNSLLLRVGEAHQNNLKQDEEQIFRFIIDERSSFQVIQTMNSGYVDTYLIDDPSSDFYIEELHGSMTINIDIDNPSFHTEKMYYLLVKATSDSDFTLQINQQRQIQYLSDGVPIRVTYFDEEDTSKPMIFMLPDGNQTVNIQVKNKGSSSYPNLYVKFYEDLESEMKYLEFPPAGESGYDTAAVWDYKYGVLKFQKSYNGISGGKAGLAINLFSNKKSISGGQFQITATSSSVMKIVADTTYLGSLSHVSSYMIYKVDETLLQNQGYLQIEFAQCLGDSEIILIDDLQKKKQLNIETNAKNEFGRQYMFIELPRENLYVMVRPNDKSLNEDEANPSTDYLIKIRWNAVLQKRSIDYHFQIDNKVSFTKLEDENAANISWNQLYYSDAGGSIRKADSIYNLLVANDSRVKLDSICTIRPNQTYISKNIFLKNTSYLLEKLEPGQRYYVNVIAQMKVQYAEESEIVPYIPTEIFIPGRASYIMQISNQSLFNHHLVLLILIAVLILICLFVIIQRCKKSEKPYYIPKPYMEYEMTSVSGSSVGKYETPTQYTSVNTTVDGVEDRQNNGF